MTDWNGADSFDGDTQGASWDAVRQEIANEYAEPHDRPWIVGFSGGKDSTVVAHLVVGHLLTIPRSERRRQVHIIANDTLVESPLVISHIRKVQAEIRAAADAFRLPIIVATTTPDPDHTFWVNLIGRGYPTPNSNFRWCTDRMKIQPTSGYIREQADASGEVVLLLGVRRDESATRAGSIARHDNGHRLNPHNDLANCLVFRPIVEMSTDDVWEFLATEPPPWGGSHDDLIRLYRDAGGGECPVVTGVSDAPSCGATSSRFGCWTCTVVDKDRSLQGFVDAGFEEFTPILDFRDWLVSIRNDPHRRLARRRNGRITFAANGRHIPGPFTLDARAEMLGKLLELQSVTKRALISPVEIERIHALWAEDALAMAARSACRENERFAYSARAG